MSDRMAVRVLCTAFLLCFSILVLIMLIGELMIAPRHAVREVGAWAQVGLRDIHTVIKQLESRE